MGDESNMGLTPTKPVSSLSLSPASQGMPKDYERSDRMSCYSVAFGDMRSRVPACVCAMSTNVPGQCSDKKLREMFLSWGQDGSCNVEHCSNMRVLIAEEYGEKVVAELVTIIQDKFKKINGSTGLNLRDFLRLVEARLIEDKKPCDRCSIRGYCDADAYEICPYHGF